MLFTILTSLLLICLLHYLYIFFINTLTTPKTIDLIHRPLAQYNEIHKTINSAHSAHSSLHNIDQMPLNSQTSQPLKSDNMQDELRSFLHDLKRDI